MTLVTPFLGLLPKETSADVSQKKKSNNVRNRLVCNTEKLQQPKYPLRREWLNRDEVV